MILDTIKIKYMNIDSGKRILVTSDIHGHLHDLQKLLEKANFNENDILFIVGDMIEKGPESLKTLLYIMKLCEKGNVIPLIGNVDAWRLRMIDGICEESIEGFFDYLLRLRAYYGTSFFDELASEIGYTVEQPKHILTLKDKLIAYFEKEFTFIANLPTIVETQNYTFVHGGLRDKALCENEKRNL